MKVDWSSDPRVLFLRELVETNSGTQNPTGVNQVQDKVAAQLRSLGFAVERIANPKGERSGDLLVATRQKKASGYIDLLTHADTVFETASGFLDFRLEPSKNRATGPGVIDDKGGIVVALDGLKKFVERGGDAASIRFLCTPSEEVGSIGFHDLFKKLSAESKMVLGFEPSLEDGSIIESRRGNRWYSILVHGREAHAGRDHRSGINAAHELAFKITQLHALSDPGKEITVSTGQIEGGSKFNIVCGEAAAKIDVRFGDFESRERIHQAIEKIVADAHIPENDQGELPRSSYSIADDCPPFTRIEKTSEFVQKYRELIGSIEGRTIRSVKSGGAADANYMSRPGLIILDGLGPTGGGMHRKDEFLDLGSLETRSEALAGFLEFAIRRFSSTGEG